MESSSFSIFPIPPTGAGRRIALVSLELHPNWPINRVFVYPSLDVDRLKTVLEHALSLWPVVCGHIQVDDASANNYSLVCSDKGVPFTFIENTQLTRWPTDLPVVVSESSQLAPYLDPVVDELRNCVPLLRFKVTHLTCSGEYIFGVSFSHVIGDAASAALFLNDLSRLYQHLEPLAPRPVFERHVWSNDNVDLKLFARMKQYRDGGPIEELLEVYRKEHQSSDPITMIFSSNQLALLRTRASNDQLVVSTNDALVAYVIFRLNTHFFLEQQQIQRASIVVSYRGISTALCAPVQVGNCFMHIVSDDFSDPYSFSTIAQTLRHSINKAREESFAMSQIAAENFRRKQLDDKNFKPNWSYFDNEVSINSQYKCDWVQQVDFGMKNQCRMHMSQATYIYLRVFQANPVRGKDGTWTRDVGAGELSIRLTSGPQKERFVQAWKNDMKEDFAGI
jgi:hypothetical protein